MAIAKQIFLCVVLLTTPFILAQDSSQDSSQANSSEGSFEVDSFEVLIEEPTSTTTTTVANTTTTDETVTASNVTLVCPEGESEIIDVTSCYILCTSQEIFYTSNGFKEPGFDCEIRDYVEQTNKLLATYAGECDGKGHCIKVENSTTTTTSTSMANTTLEK